MLRTDSTALRQKYLKAKETEYGLLQDEKAEIEEELGRKLTKNDFKVHHIPWILWTTSDEDMWLSRSVTHNSESFFVPFSSLRATQVFVVEPVVAFYYKKLRRGEVLEPLNVICTADENIIIDGHHRAEAYFRLWGRKAKVLCKLWNVY
jgi:hypothetical protein